MTETKWINLDDVILWSDNPNLGDIGAIIEMIREFNYRWPIGLSEGQVTKSGNHRVQALRMLRDEILPNADDKWQPSGPCLRVLDDGTWQVSYIDHSDLTPAQSDAFALADNRAVRLGHDDMAKLAMLLEKVYHDENIPIDATGYSAEDLNIIQQELSIPDDFPEYTEDIENEVEYMTCPHCGEEFPK